MRRFSAGWAVAGLIGLTCLPSCAPSPGDDLAYPVGDFTLTDQNGRVVRPSGHELAGKVWVASFIFTRCSGPCPLVSAAMEQLQKDFADDPDVVLVTFTVDPEYDTPKVLQEYGRRYHADPDRWLFLTGNEADVDRLLSQGFHVGATKNTGPDATPGTAVTHDTHLAVVDKRGVVRAYFSGLPDREGDNFDQEYGKELARLRREVAALRREGGPAEFFPPLNAALNAAAGVLLLLGFAAVRRRMYRVHAAFMLSALAVSAVFLASYLYFHIDITHFPIMHFRTTKFADQWPDAPRWVEMVYFVVLGSHTVLAAATAPLALVTAYLGLRNRLTRHRAVARWTLPIWLYVSTTGVVVYWMLYRLY